MILTAAELRKLTGYREPADQIRGLRSRGDKKFSGHKSDAQAAAYNVKPIKSPSH